MCVVPVNLTYSCSGKTRCVKSVQIRSFFWSVFSRIWTDTPYLSVFSPNTGKYGPEKTPYLDTFHVVNVKTHALLDSCSQETFMLEELLRDLGVNGQKTSITIKTVNGEVNNKTRLVAGLKVSNSRDEDGERIELLQKHLRRGIFQ